MSVKRKAAIFAIAFLLTFVTRTAYNVVTGMRSNDLYFPTCAAVEIMRGVDPYSGVCEIRNDNAPGRKWPTNPMTAVLVAMPFSIPFGENGGLLATILLWSTMTALMVTAILARGKSWQLLIMLTPTFWDAFVNAQWSVLMTAIYLLPELLPLSIVKPQSALALIAAHLTRRRLIGLVVFGLLTLIIDPTWPLRWLPQAGGSYDGFVPALVLPFGPLALLACLRWRDPKARFLLVAALSPQRGIYDQLPLYLQAPSAIWLIAWTALSWLVYLLPIPIPYPAIWTPVFYLPCLIWLYRADIKQWWSRYIAIGINA